MANKKFSEFELKTNTSDVSHIVGYNGAENVQITPANFLDTTGGPYLPLAGGTMTGTNGVVFPDNFYLNLGTSSDFEIYHDGNNSYLKDQGTGELILASNGTGIKLEKTTGEKMIHALTDGAVELYFNSVKKFETTLLGATVTGNLGIGASPSFNLQVGGTNLSSTSSSLLNHQFAVLDDATTGFPSGFIFKTQRLASSTNRVLLNEDFGTYFSSQVYATSNGIAQSDIPIVFAPLGGNFGIGDNSPSYKISVKRADTSGDYAYFGASSDGGARGLVLSSTDNGIFLGAIHDFNASSGSGQLTFSIAGSEKMRLDASGNLGLGVSTFGNFPTAIELLVKGSASNTNSIVQAVSNDNNSSLAMYSGASATDNPLLVFQNDLRFGSATDKGLGGYSEKMRLDASGNLGIGTLADIYGNLHLEGAGQQDIVLTNSSADGVSGSTISRIIGQARGYGNNGAVMQSIDFETNATNWFRGDIVFKTNNGDGTDPGIAAAERMRISSAGNLGLGTSTPDNLLHIANDNGDAFLRMSGGGSLGDSYGGYVRGYGISGLGGKLELGVIDNNSFSKAIEVEYGGTGIIFSNSNVEKMRLKNGNLGVGTTTPLAKAHILKGVAASYTPIATANTLVVESDVSTGISIIGTGAAGTTQSLIFGTPSDVTGAQISYNSNNSFMSIGTTSASNFLQFLSGNGSEGMRLDASGNLLIGVTSITDATSRPYGNAFAGSSANGNWTSWGSGSHSHAIFRNATNIVGTITTNSTTTAYNTSSDYRLKEDLQDFKGLELVCKIPVYDYKWKADESRSYGVMAHELEEVLPQAVSGDKDAEEMQSVDYSKIVPLLVKSIQELTAKVEKLELNK